MWGASNFTTMTKTKLSAEQKQANREARAEAKKQAKRERFIQSKRDQKPVASIVISIEWKKSRMWGSNPYCSAEIRFADGSFERSEVFTASGCGYDKESTVIAEVFNTYLAATLYKDIDRKEAPYGIRFSDEYGHQFEGGVGTSCYYDISKFIGAKFERVASGKTFDAYKFTAL